VDNRDLLSPETQEKLVHSLSATSAGEVGTLSTRRLTTSRELPVKEVVVAGTPPEGAGTNMPKGIHSSVAPLHSLRERTKTDGILAPPLPEAAIRLAGIFAAHTSTELDIDHAVRLAPLFQSDKTHEKEIFAAAEWTTKDPWWGKRINANMFEARFFATIVGQYRGSTKNVAAKPKVAPPKAAGLYNPAFDMGGTK
jgi:hypothetical protein